MRLWLYLSLIVNSVSLLLFVGYAAFDAQQQSQQRLVELQRDTNNIGRSLAAGLTDDLLAEDLDKLEQQLKRVMTITNIRELSIADNQGRLLVKVQRQNNNILLSSFEATETIALHPVTQIAPDFLYELAPIEAGKTLGWVKTVMDLAELEKLRQHIWRDKMLSALLSSILLSLVFFFKLRRDSHAMVAASQFASQLGATPATLQIDTPIRELQQLQQSLNQAAQLLAQQFSALNNMSAEQKQTNFLLQETVNELAARQFALDQHAIVSITDLQGNITYVNENFVRISQYSQQELLGQNHRMIKSGMHDVPFYQNMWETISAGKVWHGEIANRSKEGYIYWVASTIVPMLDVEGLPHHYISIRTDISYQKRTREQLSMNQKYLEQMVDKYRLAEQQLAQAQKRELQIGHQIQQSMLFGDVPARIGPIALAVYTEPSRGIDGDFYQLIHYSENSFDFSIGDVMGKGVPAALVGAAVKLQMNQTLAALLANRPAQVFPAPDEIINHLHQQITPQLIKLDTFVTLSYLHFDLPSQQLVHINAGHNPTLLCRQQQLLQLHGDNLPLGVMADEIYQQQHAHLQAGDTLFLYSDGITEAKNAAGEEFGLARLSELVLALHQANIPAAVLVQAVRYQVNEFEQDVLLSDDRTCLAIQLLDETQQSSICADYSWQVSQLDALRLFVQHHGQTSVLGHEALDALLLATIEAASNILRHNEAYLPDARLYCSLTTNAQGMMVDLYYLGTPFTPPDHEPDFSGASEGGFGLFIIRNSVDQVAYRNPAPHVCLIHLEKYHETYSADGTSLL